MLGSHLAPSGEGMEDTDDRADVVALSGGRFSPPCGDTFVAAVSFPHEKVDLYRIHRGRIIAAVMPCCCCDAACAAKPIFANVSTRLSAGTSIDPDRQDWESERSALSAHAARFHPARALLHAPLPYGKDRSSSTISSRAGLSPRPAP
jgi:hypothetical protein